MKVSIIIPFHKGLHFLKDCFEGIRDQGLSNFETVLVLDHIVENVSDLIEEYKDLNINIVELDTTAMETIKKQKSELKDDISLHFEGNRGVAIARNKGLEAATGKYIYFIDSDDYIINNTLPMLIKEAEDQDADIAYGRMYATWFRRQVFLASMNENNESLQGDNSELIKNEISDRLFTYLLENKSEEALKHSNPPSEKEIKQLVDAYYHLVVAKKGIKNLSVLGILFRKSFLINHNLQFPEQLIYYSDSPFLMKALAYVSKCSYVEEAIYVKREHNDPIHYPALSQVKVEEQFDELTEAYRLSRQALNTSNILRYYFDKKLINYFTDFYAPKLRRSEEVNWKTSRFTVMQELIREVEPGCLKELKGYRKRVVKALLSGKIKLACFHVNLHLGKKKIGKIRKNPKLFSYYLYNKFFTKMQLKENWVLCESFFGKSYSDSPKYIYEYLSKEHPEKYRFIWVLNKRTKLPFKATQIKRFSLRYAYYLARCKYSVFNGRQPDWVRKREGSVFLETWHGTPLKKLAFDQEEVMGATQLYKAQFYKQSRIWDYLVSANHFSTEVFRRAFLFDKEILEFGYPRNDILHSHHKDEISERTKEKLNIPKDKKTILYAPTWRDDEYYGKGEYKFALQLDLKKLKRELGQDYVILLRTHYFIADSLDVKGLEDFAYNVSKYDDISELYLISDILITDYSSVFFDYANLKRPILFYTYDLDKYRDMLRGFYMDIETEVPGPLLYNNDEVIDAIKNIDVITESYKEKYDEFYERFCGLEDGHASEKVVKKVFQL